ncbi:MAG: cyclic nucleotide-binding domain-containing protein [Elusimicrobia bacterium]|nr:cyclic nucleotide-binding domain-containing protein [Elusimicrobiota bacterium]
MVKISPSPDDLATLSRLLRKVEFFSPLSVGQIDKVLPFILFYGYKKGERVVRQGEIGDAFYIVQDGQLEVSIKKWVLGFSKKMAVLKAGDFFGEMALLERTPRGATVRALTPSKLFALTCNDFSYFLKENPAFADAVRKLAARRKFEDSHR